MQSVLVLEKWGKAIYESPLVLQEWTSPKQRIVHATKSSFSHFIISCNTYAQNVFSCCFHRHWTSAWHCRPYSWHTCWICPFPFLCQANNNHSLGMNRLQEVGSNRSANQKAANTGCGLRGSWIQWLGRGLNCQEKLDSLVLIFLSLPLANLPFLEEKHTTCTVL